VERVIERRGPADHEPTQCGKLRYELDSSLVFSGPMAEDRRREITQALTLRDQLVPLLAQPTQHGPQLVNLVKRVDYYSENQPPTPYRPAILQVQRRAESARRGESPPVLFEETAAPATPTAATVGQLAPDFIANDLTGSGSARPRRWLGKPVLLIFYNPASPTATEVLRFAQRIWRSYPEHVTVVGLAVGEIAAAKSQHQDLGLAFPVLDGGGLRISYAVETTPKFVILDSSNIVRGAWLGWGRETPAEVVDELKRWLSVSSVVPATPPR
jgi:peroxiredoxin